MHRTETNERDFDGVNSFVEFDDEGMGLADYIDLFLESKWLIAFTTILSVLIGAGKAFIEEPTYKADALIQIEETTNSLSALDQVNEIFEVDTPVNAQVELLRSRMVLGLVVDNLKLNVYAQPVYYPVIGRAIARRYSGPPDSVSSALFDQTEYAWGGEEIKVETFIVPNNLVGQRFILLAREQGKYRLYNSTGDLLLKGQVGKTAELEMRDDNQRIRLFVSVLKSRYNTQFELIRRPRLTSIGHLQQNFSVKEKGRQSGILEMNLTGSDPAWTRDVLNEIANIYVRQNVERKSAEAQKTLDFLEQQLPKQKEQLEAAVTALNNYRTQKGSVDLTFETTGILQGIVNFETQLTLLHQKREPLRQKFTPSHPNVIAIDAQIARIGVGLSRYNKKVEELPDTQQIILRLSRDVQVSTELYTALLNSAQELRLAKAGTVGNVRIVDYAFLPTMPIKPRKSRIVLIALILGLFFGAMLAFLRRSFHLGVDDPDMAEHRLGIPVYTTIPHSKIQAKLARTELKQKNNKRNDSNKPLLLSTIDNNDLAVESLRSLRTSLHFALLEAKNNIIMITGSSPEVGKTFVSANLAVVLANSGKNVLLIDGDLRKGCLHRYFGIQRDAGLSDCITGSIDADTAIHETKIGNVHIIPTGKLPPNPSELLLHERFSEQLKTISERYDQVIIDSPPVLAVTDAAIIGRAAGATLLVVRAGRHPIKELEQCIKRLKQAGVNLRGMIFNDIEVVTGRYRYGKGKYVYQYSYEKN